MVIAGRIKTDIHLLWLALHNECPTANLDLPLNLQKRKSVLKLHIMKLTCSTQLEASLAAIQYEVSKPGFHYLGLGINEIACLANEWTCRTWKRLQANWLFKIWFRYENCGKLIRSSEENPPISWFALCHGWLPKTRWIEKWIVNTEKCVIYAKKMNESKQTISIQNITLEDNSLSAHVNKTTYTLQGFIFGHKVYVDCCRMIK